MLTRKEHDKEGIQLPSEWKEKVESLFNKVYESKCQHFHKKFEVFGLLYEEELVLIVSFLEKDSSEVPISCFISTDMTSHQKKDKVLDKLVDACGSVFDNLFSRDQDVDEIYSPYWEEYPFQDHNFFVKISREDVGLTLEADRILQESSQKST